MHTCLRNRLQRSRPIVRSPQRRADVLLLGFVVATVLSGCITPPPPYVPAQREPPPMAHCFDGVPHIPGSTPFVLDGACCCTPTEDLMRKLHADGICQGIDADGLITMYHDKGIKLVVDHQRCNNLCEFGPHVTKGGKCMVPPTPGTRNYEEVVTGKSLRPPPQEKTSK
jgi:hypothetical protein